MQIRRINSEAALVPTTGYSQALEVAGHTRMLFVSGQIPVGADGTVPEGFEAQCRLAWSNVEAQLKAAGMTLDNLVMHRTYLADRRYTMLNRAVRSEVLGGYGRLILRTVRSASWMTAPLSRRQKRWTPWPPEIPRFPLSSCFRFSL